MKQTLKFVLAGCVVAGLSVAADETDWSKLPPSATQASVTFANDIQPIFNTSCIRCHGAERAKADFRLDTLEGVMKGGEYPVTQKYRPVSCIPALGQVHRKKRQALRFALSFRADPHWHPDFNPLFGFKF